MKSAASSIFERWTTGERSLPLRLYGALAYPASLLYRAGGAFRPPLSKRFPALQHAKFVVISSPLVGGVGKTPLTTMVADRLMQSGMRVSIVTLGHGRIRRGDITLIPGGWRPEMVASSGDEAAELSYLTGAPVHVGNSPERVIDALDISGETDWILFDDGLTRTWTGERRVIVLNECEVTGPIRYVPFGRWRTSPEFLKSACFVAVAAMNSPADDRSFERDLSELGYDGPIGIFEYRADGLASLGPEGIVSETTPPTGRPFAFCGIARPNRFLEAARPFGVDGVSFRTFSDHYAYTSEDIASLEIQRKRYGCDWYLTTLKDAVKINSAWHSSTPLCFLRIALHQVAGVEILTVLTKDGR